MRNFRKVLLVTIGFLLLCAVMALGLIEAFIHSEYAFDEDVRLRADLAGEIDYIFLGASHVQQGILPAEVDAGLGVDSYLLADGWQSLDLSRTLLETELARNPVKEVVLDVSFSTMTRTDETDSIEGDLYALPRLQNTAERLAYIRKTFDLKGYKDVFISYMQYGSEYLINKALGRQTKHVIDENKGFKDMVCRNVRIKEENIEKIHKSGTIKTEWRQQNIDQLTGIIDLCREKGIRVSIIVVPVSLNKIWHYEGWDIFYQQLQDYCAGQDVDMIDFNLLKERFVLFSEETSYSNTEHLCTEGAKAFTPVYIRVMKDLREGRDISSQFYTSYEEMEQHCLYAE